MYECYKLNWTTLESLIIDILQQCRFVFLNFNITVIMCHTNVQANFFNCVKRFISCCSVTSWIAFVILALRSSKEWGFDAYRTVLMWPHKKKVLWWQIRWLNWLWKRSSFTDPLVWESVIQKLLHTQSIMTGAWSCWKMVLFTRCNICSWGMKKFCSIAQGL